jgi:hypothetical protein
MTKWQCKTTGHTFSAPLGKYSASAAAFGLVNLDTEEPTVKQRRGEQGSDYVRIVGIAKDSVGGKIKSVKLIVDPSVVSELLTGVPDSLTGGLEIKKFYVPTNRYHV